MSGRERRSRNPPSARGSAVMAQMRPGFLFGGEARYLRRYEGIGLEDFAGQALFVGPTAYFQLSRALAADRGLEHSGMGTPGRVERRPRSRQFRAPPGAAGVRREFLGRGSKESIRKPDLHGVVKPSFAGFVAVRGIYSSSLAKDVWHESDRPDRHGMCRAVADHLRGDASGFSWSGSLRQCVMAAPPYIAQWVGEHPKWNAVKWRCEYPHSNDKAMPAKRPGRLIMRARLRQGLLAAVLQVLVRD